MRQLTKGYTSGPIGVVPSEPDVFAFDIRGRKFVLDTNTLALAQIEDTAPLAIQKEISAWAARFRPSFSLTLPLAPAAILFNMTDACNLSCDYCMARQDSARSRDSGPNLSFETAVKSLSRLLPKGFNRSLSPSGRLGVSFFGGEPLLRFETMRDITTWLERTANLPLGFHVTTNGTLIDGSVAQFLSQHRFSTIVSLDGPREAHDELRKSKDGKGSFDRVIKGLEALYANAPAVSARTTLRATFTSHSLLTSSLPQRLTFLNDLCDSGLASSVSVEPAFLGESTCVDPVFAKDTTPDMDGEDEFWSEVYSSTADWWLARFREGKRPRFHHFNAYLGRFVRDEVHSTECGAGKSYFSISPDGTIYACHRESNTSVGHCEYGIDQALAAPWSDNRFYARLRCPQCPLRHMCGGGCREVSSSAGLGTCMPLKAECALKMHLFRSVTWILSEIKAEERPRLHEVLGIKQDGARRPACASPSS